MSDSTSALRQLLDQWETIVPQLLADRPRTDAGKATVDNARHFLMLVQARTPAGHEPTAADLEDLKQRAAAAATEADWLEQHQRRLNGANALREQVQTQAAAVAREALAAGLPDETLQRFLIDPQRLDRVEDVRVLLNQVEARQASGAPVTTKPAGKVSPQRSGKRRPGKPDKDQPRGEVLILAALKDFYRTQRHDPPTGEAIAAKAELSRMTVSRFMNKHFHGQHSFEAAYRKPDFLIELNRLEGLLPSRHQEYNDANPPIDTSRGRRRHQAPGTKDCRAENA